MPNLKVVDIEDEEFLENYEPKQWQNAIRIQKPDGSGEAKESYREILLINWWMSLLGLPGTVHVLDTLPPRFTIEPDGDHSIAKWEQTIFVKKEKVQK